MTKTYLVVFEKGKENYSGFAPDVEGCGSVGDTLDEMRDNLREALQLYVDYSVEKGLAIPDAKTEYMTIPIEGETDPDVTYTVERLTVSVPQNIYGLKGAA